MSIASVIIGNDEQMGSTTFGAADPVTVIGSAALRKLTSHCGDCCRVGSGGRA
jgi:hypothetical protein